MRPLGRTFHEIMRPEHIMCVFYAGSTPKWITAKVENNKFYLVNLGLVTMVWHSKIVNSLINWAKYIYLLIYIYTTWAHWVPATIQVTSPRLLAAVIVFKVEGISFWLLCSAITRVLLFLHNVVSWNEKT